MRCEYEIIDKLKKWYAIKSLCKLMNVSRSGYYKWLKRKGVPNRYELDRQLLTNLLQEQHLNQHER